MALHEADETDLRRRALAYSLFAPTTLAEAIERLGFVQADPIRAPARAQDLILRQRVAGYRAGDLERAYPSLEIEEGELFLYGFLPRRTWELLHPRAKRVSFALDRKILEHLREQGALHPRDLEAAFGRKREVNAWGGQSKATTRALDRLHFHGHARIARRDGGVRVFEASVASVPPRSKSERLRMLVMVFARLLAPVLEGTLQTILGIIRRQTVPSAKLVSVRTMIASGELEAETCGGKTYVWPTGANAIDASVWHPNRVRILAPFDPVVWDRKRFERFWGWSYRFEAYTPPAKRVRGYYAMPLLWHDEMIGWANLQARAGELEADIGFIGHQPKSRAFEKALAQELESIRAFLTPRVMAEPATRRGEVPS
jgi:uncharacterized protein YcaQ